MDEKREVMNHLIVGVDGTEDGEVALRFAAHEALRTGCAIHLVHVLPVSVVTAPMLLMFQTDTLRAVGNGILDDAESLVRTIADGSVALEKHLLGGPRVTSLVAAAGTAPIVLGPRPADQSAASSPTAEIAAFAQGPVVSVPREWQPGAAHGVVLAGVDGSPVSRAVLESAFAAAAERDARLNVLHAWRPPTMYEVALGGRMLAESWERQAEPAIWELLAGLRGDYPQVQVEVSMRFARPEAALMVESRFSDLLVLGRRGDDRASGLALGANARALIQSAACPVEIAPTPTQRLRLPSQRKATPQARVPQQGVLDPGRR